MALGFRETAQGQEISLSTQAEILAEFLDALKIKTADIVANDTGGEVAQLFVARYPQSVRSLLLSNCDGDANSPPPSFESVLAAAQKAGSSTIRFS